MFTELHHYIFCSLLVLTLFPLLKNSEAQRQVFVCVSVGDFFLRVPHTPNFLLVVFTRVVTVMIFIFKIKKILPKILEIQWVFLGSHPNWWSEKIFHCKVEWSWPLRIKRCGITRIAVRSAVYFYISTTCYAMLQS